MFYAVALFLSSTDDRWQALLAARITSSICVTSFKEIIIVKRSECEELILALDCTDCAEIVHCDITINNKLLVMNAACTDYIHLYSALLFPNLQLLKILATSNICFKLQNHNFTMNLEH